MFRTDANLWGRKTQGSKMTDYVKKNKDINRLRRMKID